MWTVSDESLIEIYVDAITKDLPEEFISLVLAEIRRRALAIPSEPDHKE